MLSWSRWGTIQAMVEVAAEQRVQVTKRVTLVGAFVNLVLAAVKIVVGILSSAQALVADGIHSLSDLLTDAMVFYAAGKAHEAPDTEHPYGHGRIETIATLVLGIFLLLVALGIVWDAVDRLRVPEDNITPGIAALWGAAFSIVANEVLYWYTLFAGRKINSSMLVANAWHHRSDAVSSIVVLVGLALAQAGMPWLDPVTAIIVALMIGKIAWPLMSDSIKELVDTGLEEKRLHDVETAIKSVAGVEALHMLRTRFMANQVFADVHVQVRPRISVSEGHMVSEAVRSAIVEKFDEVADVTVHIDPEDDESGSPSASLPMRNEIVAALCRRWSSFPELCDSEIRLHYLDGKIDCEVFVPVAAEMTRTNLDSARRALSELPYLRHVTFYEQRAPL